MLINVFGDFRGKKYNIWGRRTYRVKTLLRLNLRNHMRRYWSLDKNLPDYEHKQRLRHEI